MLRKWQFWLGIVISVIFVYVALLGLDLRRALEVAAQANYWWILPGIVVYFGAVWARTWRWHYLLRPIKDVSLPRLFPVVVIGYMANNVYPARAGEVIRSFVLRQREDIAVSASLATILVERIFDGVVMLLFVFLSLPLTPMPDWLRQVVIVGSLLFFGALALFLVTAANPVPALRVGTWAIDRLVPERFRLPLKGIMSHFMEGLQALRSPRDVLMIFVTSVVIWLLETLKYWFVMHCFNFSVPFYVLMLMNGVVNLATTIPSSPGYVGTFDAPGIKVLQGFGVSAPIATSYTVVLHAALWLPITLMGIFYMWRESISWKEFGLAAKSRDQMTTPPHS
jgi:glycosyltransferase 2 family protein